MLFAITFVGFVHLIYDLPTEPSICQDKQPKID